MTDTQFDRDIFDVPCDAKNAFVQILPMPFDATTSYRPGAAKGPEAVLAASRQVDLCDVDVGSPHQVGIHLEGFSTEVIERNNKARLAVQRIREAKEDDSLPSKVDFDIVNLATQQNNLFVYDWATEVLQKKQFPVVLGGDHSVPWGLIKACAEAYGDEGFGILHIDAHCDLRNAYEGFADSHASIMYNVQSKIPQVKKLTQVGIRDFCQEELDVVTSSNGRIKTFFDKQLRQFKLSGRFLELCPQIINTLPQNVYLSFDIDGLDPTLCPNTGTPVPGGLSFDEIIALMECLALSGRTIVGMDLCEVSPPPQSLSSEWGDAWDANVGARILYKMIGFALISQKIPGIQPPHLPAW